MSQGKISILIEAIDKASMQLQNVGKAVGGLSDKIGSLGSTAKIAAGFLLGQLAHEALGALTRAAGIASSGFMDYERTLIKIVSATNATGREAEELTRALAQVSEAQTDLGFTAADSARGLEALVKAGMSGSDAAKALRSALSLAALESISTEKSAHLLVQTLTMFKLKANDSADALNVLSKAADAGIDTAAGFAEGIANCGAAASNMGMSLEETLAALVQLDKTYGSATQSGTYLNSMFKDLIKKSDQLGITLYNQDGTMKSLSEIIGQLRGKVKAFGSDQEAVNEYLSVFDVRAQRAVLGLINYDGSISDTMDSMRSARDVQEKMNMVMDTTAGKTAQLQAEMDNAGYALGEMTSQMTLTWKQFALGLGPIGAVADALGPSLLQGAISGLMIVIPQLIAQYGLAGIASHALAAAQWLVNAAMAANPIMLVVIAIAALVAGLVWAYQNVDWFREAVNNAGKVLHDFFKPAIDAVVGAVSWLADAISGFVSWFGPAWSGMTQAATSTWNNFWAGAQQFISDPIGTITSGVRGLAENMTSKFNDIYQETGNIWKATWETLKTIPVVGQIVGAVEGLGNQILGIFGLSMDDVFNVWQGAWDSLQSFIANPIESIQSGVAGLGNWLQDSFSGFTEALKGINEAALNAISDKWGAAGEVLKSIQTGLSAFLTGDWETLGASIVSSAQGALQMVNDVFTTVWNGIKNFLSGIWNILPVDFQAMLTSMLNIGQNVLNQILGVFTGIFDGIKNAVTGLWHWLTGGSAWQDMFSSMLNIAMSMLENIKNIFFSGFTNIQTTISNALSGALNTVTDFASGAGATLSIFGSGVVDTFNNFTSGASSSVTNFVSGASAKIQDFAYGAGGTIADFGSKALNTLFNFASGGATAVTNFVSNTGGKIADFASSSSSKIVDFAVTSGKKIKDFASSAAAKISSFTSTAGSSIRNFASGASSAIKNFTSGASRVLSGFGQWLTGGSFWTDLCEDMEKSWQHTMTSLPKATKDGITEMNQAMKKMPGVEAFSAVGDLKADVGGFTGGFARKTTALEFNAPLVVIEGDASEATAKLAADLILKKMRKYVVS